MYLERQPHTGAVRLCEAVKLSENNKLLEVEGHVPQCPMADDTETNQVAPVSASSRVHIESAVPQRSATQYNARRASPRRAVLCVVLRVVHVYRIMYANFMRENSL